MSRRKTEGVKVGKIVIGSDNPIVVQSMLNTDTMDIVSSVDQAIRIFEAGGELVRITAQGIREASNLENIHREIGKRGYDFPLSADIHFNPEAASIAAKYVEKVRINPGNFADKQGWSRDKQTSEIPYQEALTVIRKRVTAFLEVCRSYGRAVRIGTNHGSLSARILDRYGNSPEGMVEATMEYLRICKEYGFSDVVISLKSSDCRIMIEAVRLLVKTMEREGMAYPLHLGVTEAGEGEDGRIRSAVGIGALLNEGIGDTIRVSLTEDPESEIAVAKELIKVCSPNYRPDMTYKKMRWLKPVIVADISHFLSLSESVMTDLDFHVERDNDPVYGTMLSGGVRSPEFIYTEALGPELSKLPAAVNIFVPYETLDVAHVYNRRALPVMERESYLQDREEVVSEMAALKISSIDDLDSRAIDILKEKPDDFIVFSVSVPNYNLFRELLETLSCKEIDNRLIIHIIDEGEDREKMTLKVASQVGGFFVDRAVFGLWLSFPNIREIAFPLGLSQSIMQSAGVKRYKSEFISCPGCGRTLFDLQKAVSDVKREFTHLTKLKIAVMGCVVNGPGEMGDADYGYVGSGNGRVNLYCRGELVNKGVAEEDALDELRKMIIANGEWEEKR